MHGNPMHEPLSDEQPRIALSRNVATLGVVSLCMGMSSAMIHSLLPAFLVTVLGASTVTLGGIEGIAESTCSFMKIFSGRLSDWIGRRKPLVVLGYGLSALVKPLFPLSGAASTVLLARFLDRIGKGLRDAPRDALLADVTPRTIRGAGFGLRNALYTVGAVAGPLAAVGLMALSGDSFRLVFWLALIPAFASVAVLIVWVDEPAGNSAVDLPGVGLRKSHVSGLGGAFWWAVGVAAVLSVARFSPAFLLLKATDVGMDASAVPVMFALMNLAYCASAYPFGALSDRIDTRLQLAFGVLILVGADVALATGTTILTTVIGVGLWGLQMGVTQGLLAARVANAAPQALRGTAFGIYELAVGVATLLASISAGALWAIGGPAATFGVAACLATGAAAMLAVPASPRRRPANRKMG